MVQRYITGLGYEMSEFQTNAMQPTLIAYD